MPILQHKREQRKRKLSSENMTTDMQQSMSEFEEEEEVFSNTEYERQEWSCNSKENKKRKQTK